MIWVLKQVGGPLHGWYWCGGGNPRFQQAYEATKYKTEEDAIAAADALEKEDMGTFVEEEYLADG